MKKYISVFQLSFALCVLACGAEPLPPGARLAIIGDSITEQAMYSRNIEVYLLACAGRKDVTVFQFGWGGEKAVQFENRLGRHIPFFKPTAATVCYGMNDGGYRPFAPDTATKHETPMRGITAKLAAQGAERIYLCSPTAVDTYYFSQRYKTRSPDKPSKFGEEDPAQVYNQTLKCLRDIDEKVAAELKVGFVDLHTPSLEVMEKAKKANGPEYDVCGRDGIHPGENGHLVMAQTLLKAMGCDGKIAEVTLDMKGGATASEGHTVLAAENGKVQLESARWPFVFTDKPLVEKKKLGGEVGNRSILPFTPFNEELNRFVLKVQNLGAPKAKVIWGAESLEFAKERLEAGINLAAEFQKTPFDAVMGQFTAGVLAKQNFETEMIKVIKESRMEDHAKMDAANKALLVPVKHGIEVVPIN